MESKKSIVCVDLSDYENRKAEITKELMHAGEDVGFFYVSPTGASLAGVQVLDCWNSCMLPRRLFINVRHMYSGQGSH